MHIRGDEIVARANEYVDTPWRHQGRLIGHRIDCAGLFICVAQDLGISDFETDRYSRRPNRQEFRRAMLEMGCTPVVHAEQGDILRMAAPKWPVHVGIYEVDAAGVDWVIHAYAPARKVVREHLTETRWLEVRETMRFPE
jgi:cell wall-associated NlpC family hydrolase